MAVLDIINRIKPKLGKGRLLLLASGLAVSVLMTVLYTYQPVFFKFLDDKFFDSMLRQIEKKEVSATPVIVDLDEKSLKEFGQWPWPRYRVAALLDKIKNYGALSIGLDMVFPEPDRTSPIELKRDLLKDLRVDIDFKGMPSQYMDNDLLLAKVLSTGPFILGYHYDFENVNYSSNKIPRNPVNVAIIKDPGAGDVEPGLFSAPSVVCNYDVLAKAAPASGFITANPDMDGIVRRTPLIMGYRDKYYPSLSLACLMQARGYKQALLRVGKDGVRGISLDGNMIPVDPQGRLLIKFMGGSRTYQYVPAAEVLKGTLPPDSFKNKIIIIGTSAAGLKDVRSTPLASVFPGVEVHAAVIDNIVRKDFLVRPSWAPGLEIFIILAAGALSTVLISWTRTIWSAIPILILALLLWRGSVWCLNSYGLFLSPLIPLINLGMTFSLMTFLKYRLEEREKKFFHSAFSHYVSKTVVEKIVQSPEILSLSGEEKVVSIMFSDIRDFTSISEGLPPNQVSELLHSYFTPMTRKVTETQGTLDKYIGDSLMAFWNAPIDIRGHQSRALAAAFGMQRELDKLNIQFKEKYDLQLKMGIGLHCGKVSVGNMGSDDLFDYTIIGDSVNLASRLEGLTKYYNFGIIVSETIKKACESNFYFLEIDKTRVKGKEKAITIYAPFTIEESKKYAQEFDVFNTAINFYKQMDFERAQRLFTELSHEFRKRKIYQVYHDRCKLLQENPPGPSWDQVFSHTNKD